MKLIFWFSLFMIFYAYFGYVLVLMIIDAYRRLFRYKKFAETSKRTTAGSLESTPFVSFIITAHNEEKRIFKKIENSLAQTYPLERIEIIIASDCSTDKTDKIVLSYEDKGVKLVRAPERKGKENAQMHAVREAKGEILVFSDVATVLNPNAIKLIVQNFEDTTIGCVSSEDRFIDRNGLVSGEGLYVRYEMFIRRLESRVNTIVGLSGSFFAARREVCRNWIPDLQSDFNTLLNSIKIGLRGVSDPKSVGYYDNIADERKEFDRKVRTVLRGITVLMRNRMLLKINEYGFFAFQLFSHKTCRWLVPFFMMLLIGSNIFLAGNAIFYALLLAMQIVGYLMAILYYHKANASVSSVVERFAEKVFAIPMIMGISRIAYYFISVNLSILVAWFKYFKGQRSVLWEPSRR